MSAAAPRPVRLFSRLRSSFTTSVVGSDPVRTPQAATLPAILATPQVTVTPVLELPNVDPSVSEKLSILDHILSEVEQSVPAPVTLPAAEPAVSIPPPPVAPPQYSRGSSKESLAAATVEQPSIDMGGGVQLVEVEANPEIPVEVEGFIQHVEDHQAQFQQEIVIADGTVNVQPLPSQMQSVIVLPITPETEAAGKTKGPSWSVRWLVEWSRKLMKMFSGKIVYREA